MRALALMLLVGCPWVGPERIEDGDGDGVIAVRYGGGDCQDDNPEVGDCDADADGFLDVALGGDDCDDSDAGVHPEAPERCDGIDNDCDGSVDQADADVVSETTYYADTDGDGSGDPAVAYACQVAGSVANDADCDDTNAAIRPAATELCDGVDNDCDGVTDDVGIWLADDDGDGFGRDGTQVTGACDLADATGIAAVGGDCDDEDPHVNPGATEIRYDGIDANCNGGLDDWDGDFDGHVPAEHFAAAQAANQQQPTGQQWTIVAGDCDDTNPARFVGNPEVCDGVDNDCDEAVDAADLANAASTDELVLRSQVIDVFADVDGDGHYGTARQICPGAFDSVLHGLDSDDCWDSGAAPVGAAGLEPAQVHVDADEVCDGADNDCDGRADWAPAAFDGSIPVFRDEDGDTIGAATVHACAVRPEQGLVAIGGDCDDTAIEIYPGAAEICGDAVRQDCSGLDLFDCDGDGASGSYALGGDGTDCADDDPSIGPGATEVCDGSDNDCDGLFDSEDPDVDLSSTPSWYPDGDLDGWGDGTSSPLVQCDRPTPGSWSIQQPDCDDLDPAVNPDVPWYRDLDGDGFGVGATATFSGCSPPEATGWVRTGGDCNDFDAGLHPDTAWGLDLDGDFVGDPTTAMAFCVPPAGAPWVRLDNGIDCDDSDPTAQAQQIWYADVDTDGVGDPDTSLPGCAAPLVDGVRYVASSGDCDDSDPTISPLRDERCNGIDDDCDGAVDDADPNLVADAGPLGYQDLDGDTFGSAISRRFCNAIQPGWVAASGDCDDGDATIRPNAIEVCGNGVDDDCDGSEQPPTWYVDVDGDGFGTGTAVVEHCDPPAATGFATVDGDCDDTEGETFPGAPERAACDGIDDDCDGTVEPLLTWYADVDGDGLGDDDVTQGACSLPAGSWVLVGGDCDDLDPTVAGGTVWFADNDGDGFGDADLRTVACARPLGTVAVAGDCDDSEPRAYPGYPVERCDGIDNNCDGAMVEGTDPDVGNPFTGVQVAAQPDVGTVFVLDVDGQNGPSLASVVTTCQPYAPGELVSFGSAVFDLFAFDILDPGSQVDCDDGSGDGVLFLPDEDEDGNGRLEGLDDVFLSCGGTVAPAGYVPYVARDCDDRDPTLRVQVDASHAYMDQDGDGYYVEAVEGECVADAVDTALSGPFDCNDRSHSDAVDVSFDPVDVGSNQALEDALARCRVATLRVGSGVAAPATFLPGAQLTFEGTGATCDPGDTSGCLRLTGDAVIEAGESLTFLDIGLEGFVAEVQHDGNAQGVLRVEGSFLFGGRLEGAGSITVNDTSLWAPDDGVWDPLLLPSGFLELRGVDAQAEAGSQATIVRGLGGADIRVDGLHIDGAHTGIDLDEASTLTGSNVQMLEVFRSLRGSGELTITDGYFQNTQTNSAVGAEIFTTGRYSCAHCTFDFANAGSEVVQIDGGAFSLHDGLLDATGSTAITSTNGGEVSLDQVPVTATALHTGTANLDLRQVTISTGSLQTVVETAGTIRATEGTYTGMGTVFATTGSVELTSVDITGSGPTAVDILGGSNQITDLFLPDGSGVIAIDNATLVLTDVRLHGSASELSGSDVTLILDGVEIDGMQGDRRLSFATSYLSLTDTVIRGFYTSSAYAIELDSSTLEAVDSRLIDLRGDSAGADVALLNNSFGTLERSVLFGTRASPAPPVLKLAGGSVAVLDRVTVASENADALIFAGNNSELVVDRGLFDGTGATCAFDTDGSTGLALDVYDSHFPSTVMVDGGECEGATNLVVVDPSHLVSNPTWTEFTVDQVSIRYLFGEHAF